MTLTLLIRPGCGLCDDFVEAFASELPALFDGLAIADVDSRDDWKACFGTVIPVLLDAQGQVICQTFFEAARVRLELSRSTIGGSESRLSCNQVAQGLDIDRFGDVVIEAGFERMPLV